VPGVPSGWMIWLPAWGSHKNMALKLYSPWKRPQFEIASSLIGYLMSSPVRIDIWECQAQNSIARSGYKAIDCKSSIADEFL
jgi:hypothetical protein